MVRDIFSNHIGGASELTVIANIKQDFVPCRVSITYAARLRLHLQMLGALRRMGLEGRRAGVYVGPVDTLRTLQYIRWTLIDNDTRMLLAVNFDRPLEPYVRRIVDIGGPLLDTILCHCEDFENRASDQGFHNFIEFATKYQAPIELYAAAAPDMSVDDGDYYLDADRLARDPASAGNLDLKLARNRITHPRERLLNKADAQPLPLVDQALNIIQTLYENAHLFADSRDQTRDDLLYYRLLKILTPQFWENIRTSLSDSVEGLIAAVPALEPKLDEARGHLNTVVDGLKLSPAEQSNVNEGLKSLLHVIGGAAPAMEANPALKARAEQLQHIGNFREALDWYAKAPPKRERTIPAARDKPEGIQTGLLEKPEGVTVACMLLFRVDDAAAGRAFLGAMRERLWQPDAPEVHYNLSITHSGLKAIGVHEDVRRAFPTAFREGMAARAGMLGDIDVNSPDEWVWPRANWDPVNLAVKAEAGPGVPPDTIDIIVQITGKTENPPHDFTDAHPLFEEVREIAALATPDVPLVAVEPLVRNYTDGSKQRVRAHLGFVDGISQPQFSTPGDGKQGQYTVENMDRIFRDGGDTVVKETPTDRTFMGDILVGHACKADIDYSKEATIRETPDEIKPYKRYDQPHEACLLDGTFQVIRKLRVHTEEFNTISVPSSEGQAPTSETPTSETPTNEGPTIQELMMGRRRDGTPLTGSTTSMNDFNYADDPEGEITPLQSHVRRVNPREADTPRILRRGFSYGPPDDPAADRGLMFIAYNASIAEQFEVIQRWVSGGNSTGISSYHGDPLLAPQRSENDRSFLYHDGTTVTRVDLPKKPAAVLQWGIYAFTPSKAGLGLLADDAIVNSTAPSPQADAGVAETEAEKNIREARHLLEDVDETRRPEREAFWSNIRENHNGALRLDDYGVLVGSADGVRAVLENKGSLSVRHYWDRMRSSTGVLFLGYDDAPEKTLATDDATTALDTAFRAEVERGMHAKESAPVLTFLNETLKPGNMFDAALEVAKDVIDGIPKRARYFPSDTGNPPDTAVPGRRIVTERFIHNLIARLCVKWLGLPDKDETGAPVLDIGGVERDTPPHCPMDLIRASFYAFWPHPSQFTIDGSQDRTQKFRDSVTNHILTLNTAPPDTLLGALFDGRTDLSDDLKTQYAHTVVGVCSGFAGPTSGSFRGVVYDWIKTDQMWRLQQRLLNHPGGISHATAKEVLEEAILRSMSVRAAPALLHREVVGKDVEIGNETLRPGEKVVFSLKSATDGEQDAEKLRYFLFGGDCTAPDYKTDRNWAIHACPGQTMALCTMMAAFVAFMTYGDIRADGPLSFWLTEPDHRPA